MQQLNTTMYLLAVSFLFQAPSVGQASQKTETSISGIKVDSLVPEERKLIHTLEKNMVSIPDSITVKQIGDKYYGKLTFSGVVVLSPDRFRHPDSIGSKRGFPYMYGKQKAIGSCPWQAYQLAHEIAHYISQSLDLRSPVADQLNQYSGKVAGEIEAELITAAILEAAFGANYRSLGYPDYLIIAGQVFSVKNLIREYKAIIADQWGVISWFSKLNFLNHNESALSRGGLYLRG